MSLIVGNRYSLYTMYESIAGEKIEVIGILSYSECKKVPYDISILAINERVISVKDEDLEAIIGNENIYWCRSTVAGADGSYAEYLVWDSIINTEKTLALNDTFTSNLTINVSDDANVSLQQILTTIENSIQSAYGNKVTIKISTPIGYDTGNNSSSKEIFSDETIEKVKGIINDINLWENTLIPSIQRLTDIGIDEKLTAIGNDISLISSNLSLIKNNF